MKRVLVITYDWPPRGGEHVHRWLKLCKYLPEAGWRPIVYAPENPAPGIVDTTLMKAVDPRLHVVRGLVPEPNPIVRLLTGPTLPRLVADLARANLLIPDFAAPWIKPSVEFLTEFLVHEPVDAIVTSGPPHSCHLIGLGLKEVTKKPWAADFSDAWTDTMALGGTGLPASSAKKQKEFERSVVDVADRVVLASRSGATRLGVAGGRKTRTVMNAFDPDDSVTDGILAFDRFRINYTGTLTEDRNHEVFWEALRALSKAVIGFKSALEIDLVGRVDQAVTAMAIHYGLAENLVQTGALSHMESLERMSTAHVLYFTMHRPRQSTGFIPARLFHYLGSRRPILMIGPPESEAARIIRSMNAGRIVAPDDFHNAKTVLESWFEQFKLGELEPTDADLEALSAVARAREYVEVLEEMTNPHDHSQTRQQVN